MSQFPRPEEQFNFCPIDVRGRRISPEVLSVIREIGDRLLRHGETVLGDPAVVSSLLEESAASVSRVLACKSGHGDRISNLPAYLFRAFIRRVNRVRRSELQRRSSSKQYGQDISKSLSAELDLKILIDELLTRCDPTTREMFYRRIEGFSWKEIGHSLGISAHSAESRFSQALKRLRRQFRDRQQDQEE